MSRRTYLIPRLIIGSLLVLSIWLGRDPLIRHALVHRAQSITGAKVEIGQLRTSLANQKLFLKDIKIVDPRDPMKNLFQAEMAYLKFDLNSLLRRQIVVEHGQTHKLMFGVPRTEPGFLLQSTARSPTSAIEHPIAELDVDAKLEQLGQDWLDQITPPSALPQFSSPGSHQDEVLVQHWQQQIETLRGQIDNLNPQIVQINNTLKAEHSNPLRASVRYAQSAKKLQQLATQASEVEGHLSEIRRLATEKKTVLNEALTQAENDLQLLAPVDPSDGESLTQLLLYQAQDDLVNEVVNWFRWFQTSMPDTRSLGSLDGQGEQIIFGQSPKPAFLIQSLGLEGEGRFAGQHLNFSGTAYNLTTQPKRISDPARFELKAQGNHHINLNCVIDRRGETPADTLTVECPDLKWAPQPLGHPESLLVSVGPACRLQASVKISLEGNELKGEFQFGFSDVSLHVDQIHEWAGGKVTALRLNQELANLDQFNTKVTLNGTLDDYSYEFDSAIGQQFSDKIAKVANDHRQQEVRQQFQNLKYQIAQQIEYLDNQIIQPANELTNQVGQNVHRMAKLKQSLESPKNQSWPKIR